VNTAAWAKRLRHFSEELLTLAGDLETLEHTVADGPAVLTLAEFAAEARVSPDTARLILAHGEVPGAWHSGKGGRWKVPREGVDTWLAGRHDVVPLNGHRGGHLRARSRHGQVRDYLADLRRNAT
jgi:hypothetical protein